ncbi:hypothetical protein [Mesorhizobium sp. M0571]|uniref:hypothetical protein n=1 Tax=Mesorhizobium sp. M0571 TaxID=2956960 RepID=UPI00333BC23E
MSLSGIFSSRHQRRTFLLASTLIIVVALALVWAIYFFSPETRGWNALISLLISVVASAVFAFVSAIYISYFFLDPSEIEAKTLLLPQDIGQALRDVAMNAPNYKIYARTGRHFRAEILPILIEKARRDRHPIEIEVILLDFQDTDICKKYAAFRKTASFDHQLWDRAYVQKEVMATILALTAAANEHAALIQVELFLSSRLSTFRIEGSSQEIIVTREDPKDMAARYLYSHRDHPAFVTEFNWVRDAATPVRKGKGCSLPATLTEMFGKHALIAELEEQATKALVAKSPYAR